MTNKKKKTKRSHNTSCLVIILFFFFNKNLKFVKKLKKIYKEAIQIIGVLNLPLSINAHVQESVPPLHEILKSRKILVVNSLLSIHFHFLVSILKKMYLPSPEIIKNWC
jgi:hypothetical protein